MINSYVKGNVIVFIDAANLESSLKDLEWYMDYKKLYNYFKNYTKLVGIRFYSANFDVEITLDALNLIDKYDTLVLFSGDSDFDCLIKLLRQKRKNIIVVLTRYHISKELIECSNKYIDLEKLKTMFQRINHIK